MGKNTNTTASETDAVVEKVEKQNVEETVNDTEFVEVEFLVSPTGKFFLAYSVGEVGFVPAEQAKELIELGYAKKVE